LILALNDRDRTIADWRQREGTDWVDQMMLGGMLKCAEHGYRLIIELVDTHSDEVAREIMAALAALQPDGVILTPPHSDNPVITNLLAAQDIPFARIGSIAPGPGIGLSMDDEGSAWMATTRLVELGHRRIAMIAGSPDYAISALRTAGWRKAMTAAGLSCDGLFAEGDFSFAAGLRAAEALLRQPSAPTAIIASNDQMALATLQAARQASLEIPSDLSLISFDNTPIVRFSHPPLTAIDQPIAAVTARAVEQIIDAHAGRAAANALTVVRASLIERASTAPPRLSR
ncbi:MAG: substrate-binding domain-containing protein, partial [Polymorphobacter sp.]